MVRLKKQLRSLGFGLFRTTAGSTTLCPADLTVSARDRRMGGNNSVPGRRSKSLAAARATRRFGLRNPVCLSFQGGFVKARQLHPDTPQKARIIREVIKMNIPNDGESGIHGAG